MINFIQIDPNGLCNAGCWFCPVSTLGNPPHQIDQMPIEVFESAIKQIVELKGDLVNPNLHFIYGSHFNEVLLYKHFEQMLQVLQKYGLTLCILTNGVPLTPAKVDIINKYGNTVSQIAFNAPVFQKSLFEKRTGMKEHLYDKLLRNIQYAFNNIYNKEILLIQINGINEHSNIIKGSNFPDLTVTELEKQVSLCRSLFPNIRITTQWNLIDRAGLLKDVMYNKLPEGKVIGCASKRDTDWLHISPKGDIFLCCNDYNMDYTYGNIKEHSIKDIWLSKKRKEVNNKAFSEICNTCASAIFG